MKLRPYGWAALALIVTLGGFAAGRALRPDAPPAFAYDTEASPYTAVPSIAAESRGGFTGFGAGLEGAVVQAGRVTAVNATAIEVTSADGVAYTLRLGDAPRLLRLAPVGANALRPGSTVVARLAADGETVEALLIVAEP
jgi:hypothetical protein